MADVVLFERFAEADVAARVRDTVGNLDDLEVEAGLIAPPVVEAACGFGRQFTAATGHGLRAVDVVAGATLVTRDCSIRAILRWDLAGQAAYGSPGTIYARGKGTAIAEYSSAGLELRVVNAALGIGELRWLWQDIAGNLKTQIGGHFAPPQDGGFLIVTATRRWVTSTSVVLRYYLGDVLLAEVPTADGSIGGGTTGTTSIGTRYAGAWGSFFNGVLDELQVLDYELTREEIAATYRRITELQERGYQLVRELHPPGFPISSDATSRVQRETNLWGQALGYASAQLEDLRSNILPDRAYGSRLERWEYITRQPRKPSDSVDTRRARVCARIAQRAGVSIPGVQQATKELVATDVSNLEIISLSQEIDGHYDKPEVWTLEPDAQFTAGASLRVQAANAAVIRYDGLHRDWYVAHEPVASSPQYKTSDGKAAAEGYGAHFLSKLTPATLPDHGEVGIALWDWARNNVLLLGLRSSFGAYEIVTEQFIAGVSSGVTVQAVSALQPHWLHLYSQAPPPWQNIGAIDPTTWNYTAAWSTTSAIAGYASVDIAHAARFQRATLYARSYGVALAGALDVTFDDTRLWTPYGDRALRFWVYRDPAFAGSPDTLGAHGVIQGLKQAHTEATIITSKSVLYDDEGSGYDRGPQGGY